MLIIHKKIVLDEDLKPTVVQIPMIICQRIAHRKDIYKIFP